MSTAILDKSDAQAELGKFLKLADELGPGLKMFSTFIDMEWHQLVGDRAAYAQFCATSGTTVWEHKPNEAPVISKIEWVPDYESRWGDLPPAWFADETGVVDDDAYQDYLDSHEVVASWDCSPSTGSVASVAPERAETPANPA